MRICIDISQIIYEGTGVARFTYQLVKTLLSQNNSHKWSFFFSSLKHNLHADLIEDIKRNNYQLIRWYIPPRMLSILWNDRKLKSNTPLPGKFDVFISSDWTQPPPQISRIRATIVHDLIFKEHPKTVDELVLRTQEKRLNLVKNECQIIWCDSESTKHDLYSHYPDYKGVTVINYPGILKPAFPKELHEFPYTFKPGQYYFAVGKIEPRKNIHRLMEAFLSFISSPEYAHFHLAIAGPRGWDVDIQQFAHPQIHFLGTVDDAHLALLYQQAFTFVYPTLYEGFGIPPLEAMNLGCPVIVSNTSSLPEIATPQSALFINPYDITDICEAMKRIASDHRYRKSLIHEGYKNVSRFNWNAYTQNMLKSLDHLATQT